MKPLLLALASLTLGAAALPAAAATTIDFDEFTHSGVTRNLTRTVASGGFSFVSDSGSGLSAWGATHPNNADQGGATLTTWNAGSVAISRLDGSAFSLASIDMTDMYNTAGLLEVLFTFFDGTRTTTETFALDRVRGLKTITLDRDNLMWFTISGADSNRAFQIDNMVWDEAVVSAVPEPATWAMMIIGFAGVGVVVRRTRPATAFAKA